MKKILYITLLILSSIGWGQSAPTSTSIRATLNPGGGTQTNGSDGMQIQISGNGNIQVRYKNIYQIYSSASFNPSSANSIPSTLYNGIGFGILNTQNSEKYGTTGGDLYPSLSTPSPSSFPASTLLTAFIDGTDASGKTQIFKNTFSIPLNGRNYTLTIEYKYRYPNASMEMKYTVVIPAGNLTTQSVRLAHGWDTYLDGGDSGPGYAIDNSYALSVGVRKGTSFQAFIHKDGTKWNGYYSAIRSNLKSALNTDFMAYSSKTINPSSSTDNGIGMSIDFGSTPGEHHTTNILSFICNASSAAPASTIFTPVGTANNAPTPPTTTYTLTCKDGNSQAITIDKSDLVFPNIDLDGDNQRDVILKFINKTTLEEFNATYVNNSVNLPIGTYDAFYYDIVNGCVSPTRTIIVNKDTCTSDLSIVKTINTNSNSTVRLGNSYTITYVARNNGTSDNGGVIVTDNIPPGFTVTGNTAQTGTTYNNGVWNIGTLTSGSTATLTVTVTANSYGGHTSTATISGASTDSTPANNTSNPQIYIDYDNDGYGSNLDLDSDNDGILDATEYFLTNRVTSGVFVGTANANTDNVPGWTVGGTYATAGTWLPSVGRVHLKTDGIEFRRDKGTTTTLSQNISNISGGIITLEDLYWYKTSDGTVDTDFTFTISYNGTVYAIINSTLTNTPTITTYNGATVNTATLPTVTATAAPNAGVKSALSTIKITMPVTLTKTNGLLSFQFVAGADNTNVRDLGMKSIAVETYRDFDNDGIPDFLDLDSDADGCPDAIEGDENVLPTHLNADGSINYAANGGLGNSTTPVATANIGVPNLVNSGGVADIGGDVGQGIGTSMDAAVSSCPATIRITKDNGQTLYKRPSTSTYIITVANEGSATVNNIHFTDIVPSTFGTADFDYSATVTSGSTVRKLLTDATGTTVSGTGSVDNYINLLPGGVATYTVKLKISDEKRGNIRNVASIALPGSLVNSLPNTDDDIDSPGIDGRNDSFSNSTINPNKGGVAGVVSANDMINDTDIKIPTDALYTLNNNGGISGASINTNGELIIPTGVPAGVYTLQYTICNATTPTDCDTASILVEIFVDSDGDGVSDVIDFDDDNDGITDLIEASACGATSTKYFNEDFGTGARANFTGLLGTTNYIYEAGPYTGATSTSIEDGEYALLPNLDNVASWASTPDNTTFGRAWARTYDHTSGNGTGRMALFNATRSTSEEFYNVNNITVPTNTSVKLTFWAKNVDLKTMNAYWDKNRSLPNIRVKVLSNGVLIKEFTTGTILRDEQWHLYSVPFNTGTHTNIQFVMYNDMEGGLGNDLALDDIAISTICDSDGDGIPNELDLDSDNDGCTDAIEGAANITASQLVTATGLLATQNPNKNLGNTVDVNGIPTVVNGGQEIGNAYNAAINDCKCIKPAVITGTALDTNVGISTIGTTTGWPQNRKGAYLALESQGKGLVISRLTTTQITAIGVNSQEGMMVYDTDVDCLKIYSKDIGAATYSWKCFDTQSCPDN